MKEQEDSSEKELNKMKVKQLIRNRLQSNGFKNPQQHETGHRNHEKKNTPKNKQKKHLTTTTQPEMKNNISEIRNTLEGISRLESAN